MFEESPVGIRHLISGLTSGELSENRIPRWMM